MVNICWFLAWFLLRPIFRIFAHLKVLGLDNLENLEGSNIIIANHLSYLDPVVIALAIPPKSNVVPVKFLARKEVYKTGISFLLNAIGAILLDTKSPIKGLKIALSALKEGNTIGIFPEGTRSLNGDLLKFKDGVDFLARKAQANVLPVVILGTRKTGKGALGGLKKVVLFLFGRYKIKVIFGSPISDNIEQAYTNFYNSSLSARQADERESAKKKMQNAF